MEVHSSQTLPAEQLIVMISKDLMSFCRHSNAIFEITHPHYSPVYVSQEISKEHKHIAQKYTNWIDSGTKFSFLPINLTARHQ